MEAHTLIAALDRALPGFRDYCGSSENFFDEAALCGIFAACSHFVKTRPITADSWSALAILVNGIAGGSDQAASEAAATCLLENLAEPSHPLEPLLEGEALRYWKTWESS